MPAKSLGWAQEALVDALSFPRGRCDVLLSWVRGCEVAIIAVVLAALVVAILMVKVHLRSRAISPNRHVVPYSPESVSEKILSVAVGAGMACCNHDGIPVAGG